MSTLTLKRFKYFRGDNDRVTFGTLLVDGKQLFTMEGPFECETSNGNKYGTPFKSCVKAGTYDLVSMNKNGRQLIMLHSPENGVDAYSRSSEQHRSGCMFIRDNSLMPIYDGCITVGLDITLKKDGKLGLSSEKFAYDFLHKRISADMPNGVQPSTNTSYDYFVKNYRLAAERIAQKLNTKPEFILTYLASYMQFDPSRKGSYNDGLTRGDSKAIDDFAKRIARVNPKIVGAQSESSFYKTMAKIFNRNGSHLLFKNNDMLHESYAKVTKTKQIIIQWES